MDLGLAGRVALVVGETGLIGSAVVERLRAEGATVVAASRRTTDGLVLDGSDENSVRAGVSAVLAEHGRLDALVVTAAPSARTLDPARNSDPAQVLAAVEAFAGLYELWPDPAKDENDPDRWLWTFTILATQATDALGHIHERTPVLVPPDMRDDWLDPQLTDLDLVRQVLDALPEPTLSTREVSPAVNSPRNDSPDLIAAV
ncbi:SOS response-associated peptidase family protein [Kineococcus sp. R86509]|uniref:SOS response-associated peptidase n=1 Tax=Kineococcus sp. R86509 TaxID=3093851 RepID=UPI0036D339E9